MLKVSSINFGKGGIIKKNAKRCAYSGEIFSENNIGTFEHIIPKSRGGTANISNCLIVSSKYNNMRGNMPLTLWFKKFPEAIKNIQNYLNEMRNLRVNKRNYVEEIKRTLNKESHGEVIFKGNLNKRLDIKI